MSSIWTKQQKSFASTPHPASPPPGRWWTTRGRSTLPLPKKDDITAVVVFVDASVPCALPLCSDAQIDQLNDLEASTAANAGRAVDGWALHRVRSSHGRPISL
mmetsp:Transcript_32265/g.111030  ORF Transcript_32265/g.111030 Transcript_32265/m.111030 type:complete len:103 (-) Transcript_32265:83-391(-)